MSATEATLLDTQLAALRGKRGALIMIDVQRSFGDPEYIGRYGLAPREMQAVADAVTTGAALVERARELGVPIYWVELATEPDHCWNASQWLRTGDPDRLPGPGEPCVIGTSGIEWYGMVPESGEPRIPKRVYSGFLGTDLADRLRADGIEWVVCAGLTSECCITATATDAMQLGWPVVISTDASAAYGIRMHEQALERLALNIGILMTSAEIADVWAGGEG